ncbi:YbaN family protein [Candidatus Enterovibrio escicola]|uniref:YbaN family protein n=1 Tax=Candidatus Enterovibrio escicola TaxID=1927127 RepID=UPI001238128F
MKEIRVENSLKRILLLGLGWLCVTVGFIGIFLPLLPTTPFLLLASACFMRGSPPIAQWLHQHPKFGSIIYNWHQYRSVDRRIKLRANVFIFLSFSLSIFIVPNIWQKVMLAVLAMILLIWFNRLPETTSVSHTSKNTEQGGK